MPFYIGDWEQDMNACTLQTEAAWLKVIVKMFKDDRCGIYKTSTKRLQILWKCGPEAVEEIISELQGEDIGEIKRDAATGEITFLNRRMIREKEISKKRSEAVQTRYKPPTKTVQTPEDENEDEVETDNEGVAEVETHTVEVWPTFDDFWDSYDKKTSRVKCEKKWGKLKQDEKEDIMRHIEAYVPATPDPKYRKNPETYLNNRSWEDEFLPTQNGHGKRLATADELRAEAERQLNQS